MDALVKLLEAQRPQRSKVLLRSAGRLYLVDQKDVCFASIEDAIISVVATHLEGQSNCRTLEELLAGLDAEMFWRAHRSYVVNLERVARIEPYGKDSKVAVLTNGVRLPVSRAGFARLKELLDEKE